MCINFIKFIAQELRPNFLLQRIKKTSPNKNNNNIAVLLLFIPETRN